MEMNRLTRQGSEALLASFDAALDTSREGVISVHGVGVDPSEEAPAYNSSRLREEVIFDVLQERVEERELVERQQLYEVITLQVEALETKLGQLGDGSIIYWEVTYPNNATTYRYVALKANSQWFRTGQVRQGQSLEQMTRSFLRWRVTAPEIEVVKAVEGEPVSGYPSKLDQRLQQQKGNT